MLQIGLQSVFHAWEHRLARVTTDRVVREFDWGLDWIPGHTDLHDWVSEVMTDTDRFFTPPPTTDYSLSERLAEGDRLLTFPSAFPTPHLENNTVYCRYFEARPGKELSRKRVINGSS